MSDDIDWRFDVGSGDAARGVFSRLVTSAAAALNVDGVAITARTTPTQLQLMSASSRRAARIEDLQVTLGEGPTVAAYTSNGPVLIADLTSMERGRWPVFEAGLTAADTGGMFALPLQLGAIRLGVLSLYRDDPGLMVDGELTRALAVADAVTTSLLMTGEHALVGDGGLSLLEGSENSNEINQATGMVIAQLNVTAEVAYVRLRSLAFASGRPLSKVARDVVSRRLRLDGAVSGGPDDLSWP